jgi:hypothetical protein
MAVEAARVRDDVSRHAGSAVHFFEGPFFFS